MLLGLSHPARAQHLALPIWMMAIRQAVSVTPLPVALRDQQLYLRRIHLITCGLDVWHTRRLLILRMCLSSLLQQDFALELET